MVAFKGVPMLKKTVAACILCVAAYLLTGCSFFAQAPLRDGLYLSYDYEGTTIRVTFTEKSKKHFSVTVETGTAEEMITRIPRDDKQVIVDLQLKTDRGAIFELASLGPLWIPAKNVKVGGNAHGDSIVAVKEWQGWQIGVVKASFGVGGALRGEWYYEKNTGFLVGGNKSTIISEGGGSSFILKETNLAELQKN
jgi:hypothetical protein